MVTSRGEGIGRAIAYLFAAEGASVGVLDVDGAHAAATAEMIAEAGGSALALEADVTDDARVAEAMAAVVAAYDGIHVLVNNAGIWLPGDGSVADIDPAVWRRTIDVNLTGMYYCSRHGIRAILAGGGRRRRQHGWPVALRPEPV